YHVPADYDVCVSFDFDEILEEGWRAKIEEQFKGGSANYTLVFDHSDDGTINVSYPRRAIHERAGGFRWEHAVHEVLTGPGVAANIPIFCVHLPEKQKEPGHYLKLLLLDVLERPDDARADQYLAREYFYMGDYDKAFTAYEAHLKLEQYEPFRCETFIALGHIAEIQGNRMHAKRMYMRAISECPVLREPYVALAKLYASSEKYEQAAGILLDALTIDKPALDLVFSDSYYGHWCDHMLMVCYYRSGNFTRANALATELLTRFKDGVPADILDDIIAMRT